MLKVFISTGGSNGQENDYSRYVAPGSIQITRSLNTPSTLSIVMANYDDLFIMPPTHAYIRIWSTINKAYLFTGFLTNDPTRTFAGLGTRNPSNGQQIYNFGFTFTSDEYMLNIKSVAFIPAYVNQSQGNILRSLAETLMPGYFNFDNVASGDLVPYLLYDPKMSWAELAKQFGDASRFRYSAINREIHYQPYGDGELGIRYDEDKSQGTFDPKALQTSATTTPIVNDVTIVGLPEAGNNHEDYFVGTGFVGNFQLNHQAFGLATAEQGSAILINEPWTSTQLNTQYWNAQDPSSNFFYGVANSQSLNVLTALPQLAGTSFIASQNAIELAGGKTFQHGEFVFNDYSDGIVGGIFDSTVLNGFNDLIIDEASCEAGFRITPTPHVHVTISGASGISIRPFRLGVVVDRSFEVITKVNNSYVLTTNIAAPQATRYTQIYRSMAGSVFGNVDQTSVSGNITWSVVETDLFSAVQTTFTFTSNNQLLPITAIYVPIDNYQLNLNVTSTEVTSPIPASLNVKCAIGAGLLAPIYISGNVQYTGGFVFPSGANLPIAPSGFGPENVFALGTSLRQQAAEIDSGQVVSTLNFYGDDLPGVGVRIRLQSWQSQAAIARLQDADSVAEEAAIVGDDGVRSTIVTDLNPLPRTSEDCENAAQAFLFDRTNTFYQGTYNASYYFFEQISDNIDFYPVCGRYLFVNSPHRNINKLFFLVTSLTTSVTEMAGEIMEHSITFGPDLHLEKLLATFIPVSPNVITNLDASQQPPVQQLLTLGTTYYADPNQATLIGVSGAAITLQLTDDIPRGAHYEVRSSDLNWGRPGLGLIMTTSATGTYNLNRNSYDQTWYIKFVSDNAFVNNIQGPLSRRTKILRVVYPRVPTIPATLYIDSLSMNFDFTGDIRNIEGIELRAGDDVGVYYQAIVGSQQDMALNMVTLRGQGGPGQPTIGPIGAYQRALVPSDARNFIAHFFNLMWEYGPGLAVNIPVPVAPKLTIGFKFSSALQVIDTVQDSPPRGDYKSCRLQISSDDLFTQIVSDITQQGNPGTTTVNVPTSGALYARMSFSDFISSGAWSQPLFIPNTDLIQSTYLNPQGSLPPILSSNITAPGGLFTYTASMFTTGGGQIIMTNVPFSIIWPDGSTLDVPAASVTYNIPIDVANFQPATQYAFFPIINLLFATFQTPAVFFNGPYQNFQNLTTQALIQSFGDGNAPLSNGPFIATTPAAATTGGGGGGGTHGGGNCGVLSSIITLEDGFETTLEEVPVGAYVKTKSGNRAKIHRKDILLDDVYKLVTESGCATRAGQGHVICVDGVWKSFADIWENCPPNFDSKLVYTHTTQTKNSPDDRIIGISEIRGKEKICHIYLQPDNTDSDDDHVYLLDGIWSHNVMVKTGVAVPE